MKKAIEKMNKIDIKGKWFTVKQSQQNGAWIKFKIYNFWLYKKVIVINSENIEIFLSVFSYHEIAILLVFTSFLVENRKSN